MSKECKCLQNTNEINTNPLKLLENELYKNQESIHKLVSGGNYGGPHENAEQVLDILKKHIADIIAYAFAFMYQNIDYEWKVESAEILTKAEYRERFKDFYKNLRSEPQNLFLMREFKGFLSSHLLKLDALDRFDERIKEIIRDMRESEEGRII